MDAGVELSLKGLKENLIKTLNRAEAMCESWTVYTFERDTFLLYNSTCQSASSRNLLSTEHIQLRCAETKDYTLNIFVL